MAKLGLRGRSAAPLALVLGLATGLSTPALADFDDGLRAYDAGDYEEAMNHWLPLAEGGSAEAQFRIGQMFEQGQGVPPSLARAAMWYRLAAGQDLAAAQPALDDVLDTLRAREASQNNGQVADAGAGAGASPGGTAAATPDFEPDRDIAYAPPGQAPARVGDVDQPSGVPGRDAAPAGSDGDGGAAVVDGAGLPPALPDAVEGTADGADGAVADDGVADAADPTDEADVADAAADAVGDTAGDDAGIGDLAALDDEDITALDPLDDATADDVGEDAGIEDAGIEDGGIEDTALDETGVDDGAVDEPAIDDAAADGLVDETADDVAALNDDYADDIDALTEPVEDDTLGLDDPMPPELADALADGTLDAEEIDALVEDGVITDEMVDDFAEAGLLDDEALADLVEAGVLDEDALDALVDNGLIDETLVDDTYAALTEENDTITEVEGAVGDLIGDGIAQLFDVDQQASEPERRLITTRQ